MKTTKSKAFFVALTLTGLMGAGAVYAEETVGEKAQATGNDAARAHLKSGKIKASACARLAMERSRMNYFLSSSTVFFTSLALSLV